MRQGFFKGFIESEKEERKKVTIGDSCGMCGLYKNCQSPKMEYTGEGRKKILIFAEAPGREEDEDWKKLGYKEPTQFIGKAGQLFRKKLKKFGIDLDKDCWKDNVCSCRPPNNRVPTQKELKCCRERKQKIIEELKPEFIWLMGLAALKSFYMDRFSNQYLTLAAWRKRCVPDRENNAWVIPLYHPSFLLRSKDDLTETFYERDLRWAVSCLGRGKVSFEDDPFTKIKAVTDYDELMGIFDEIENGRTKLTYDYESNGLQPRVEGYKILTIGVCYGREKAFAFPFQYPHWGRAQYKQIKQRWISVLTNLMILKIAQNLKFEESLTRVCLGVQTANWIWDTMVASHILDEGRGGTTKLEMQAYWRWGFEDHGEKLGINKLKKSVEGGFNRLHTADLNDLLMYNAIDGYEEYLLYEVQEKEIGRKADLRRAYALSFAGLLAFADTEETGIPVDDGYYEKEDKRLGREIALLEKELVEGRYGKRFEFVVGKKINLGSPKDLQKLLFDIMKEVPVKKNKTGYSVDIDSLSKIDNAFVKGLLRVRKLKKIKDTYLSQFRRYSICGRLYPSTNLHIVRTFRSSTDKPNFQNIPIRDKEARDICRGGIIPSPGNKIMEIDYGGVEVCGMAVCTHDPALMKYIEDKTTDMHRDQACGIFMLEQKEITKELRQIGKNDFVFPEFYGDWYKQCAESIWEDVKGEKMVGGEVVIAHLQRKGIRNYGDFEKHVKNVEDKFWYLLRVSDHWRKEIVTDYYKKNGYINTLFGYRRSGYLKRNMLMNTPVQNIAFCCLLWSYIQINRIRKEEKWSTKMLGQIHDSILFDQVPEEQEHVIATARRVMCEDIRKEFDFLIVPLSVNIEVSPIDGAWNTKEKLAV